MKLKKTIIYLILILVIPLGAVLYLNNKYQNKLTLIININYNDLRSQKHFNITPIHKAFDEIYRDILMIEGVSESNQPRSKEIQSKYTRFVFDIDDSIKINEDKIKELISIKIDSVTKVYKLLDKKLNNLCKRNQYAPEVCRDYFLKFLELEYPEFEKPVIDLTTQRDIEGDIKIEKVKKFNKSNTISLGLFFSVIIILLIEIFVNQKLIFKKIKKKLN